jgi:hypothetical protein
MAMKAHGSRHRNELACGVAGAKASSSQNSPSPSSITVSGISLQVAVDDMGDPAMALATARSEIFP